MVVLLNTIKRALPKFSDIYSAERKQIIPRKYQLFGIADNGRKDLISLDWNFTQGTWVVNWQDSTTDPTSSFISSSYPIPDFFFFFVGNQPSPRRDQKVVKLFGILQKMPQMEFQICWIGKRVIIYNKINFDHSLNITVWALHFKWNV